MIKYQDLIDLGFNRENTNDSVYTQTTGHGYYLLNKNYLFASLQYNIDEGTVTVWATDFNQKSQMAWTLDDIEKVKELDRFLTAQEKFFKSQLNLK